MLRLPPEELARRARPFFEAAGLWDDAYLGARHGWFFAVLELLKPRAKRLEEFASLGRFFFAEEIAYDRGAVQKHLRPEGIPGHLAAVDDSFSAVQSFDAIALEAALRTTAEARGVQAAALIHAVRVATTGKAVSPGLFEVLTLLGRDRTHARLVAALRTLSAISS